jgi:hypothetical protein
MTKNPHKDESIRKKFDEEERVSSKRKNLKRTLTADLKRVQRNKESTQNDVLFSQALRFIMEEL